MTDFPKPTIRTDDEWAKLHELGFVSEYIIMEGPSDDRVMKPAITADHALALGFLPLGTKVKWLDGPGYPYQREEARKKIGDTVLTVQECRIGRSSSTYKFDEVAGEWNSVMFEKIDG